MGSKRRTLLLLAAITISIAALCLPGDVAGAAAEAGTDMGTAGSLRPPIEYLEDPAGALTLEELSVPGASDRFAFTPADALAVGNSRSVYWIRLIVPSMDSRYLTVINPTVQRVEAFFPVEVPGGASAWHRTMCRIPCGSKTS